MRVVTDQPSPGALLRDARERQPLSIRAVAKKAGVSDTLWRNVEAGVRTRPNSLIAMARAVGADVRRVLDAAGFQDVEEPVESDPESASQASDVEMLMATVDVLPDDQRELWFRLALSVAEALATHVTGTERDLSEKNPTGRYGTDPSLPVDRAHIDVTPDRHVVMARLGEALDLDPESLPDVVTFSQMLSQRARRKRFGS